MNYVQWTNRADIEYVLTLTEGLQMQHGYHVMDSAQFMGQVVF